MQYGPKIVRDGLVLHLDAADRKSYSGSGTAWNDLSGASKISTDTSLVTYDNNAFTATSLNQYIWFGGSNSYLQNLTNDGNNHTYECWFKPLGAVPGASNGYMFGRRGYHTGFQQSGLSIINPVIWYSDNTVQYVGNASGNTAYTIASNVQTFVHLVLVVNEAQNIALMYYNGSQLGVSTTLTKTLRTYNTADYFLFSGSGTNYSVDGSVSIARLYNKALSSSEVLQNFNATRGRFGI
jgi:hypothetical protein